jgi:hypothetical protein
MLAVHKKYRELIQEVFNGDQSFIGALDKACAFVVNHRPNPKMACKSPEMVGMVYGKNSIFCVCSIFYFCMIFINLKPSCKVQYKLLRIFLHILHFIE